MLCSTVDWAEARVDARAGGKAPAASWGQEGWELVSAVLYHCLIGLYPHIYSDIMAADVYPPWRGLRGFPNTAGPTRQQASGLNVCTAWRRREARDRLGFCCLGDVVQCPVTRVSGQPLQFCCLFSIFMFSDKPGGS